MSLIIRKALDLGYVAFLTWGNSSAELEDLIDEIIELSLDKDLSHILTISQNDEDAGDVAWFFINAIYLEGGYMGSVQYGSRCARWLHKDITTPHGR